MPIDPWAFMLVLIIVVVIFGAGRLSQIGGAVGKSVREFRTAVHDESSSTAPVAPAAIAAPAEPQVACPSCEALNAAGQKFCGKCGARMTSPVSAVSPPAAVVENTCPSCATVNPTGQAFCGQCGTRLTRAA
jgi:sec-independent protein translocase protein TatA